MLPLNVRVSVSSPVASWCSCRCWWWRWTPQRVKQSQWMTSRRRPPPQYRWWRCRLEWGAAGRWAGRVPSPHVPAEKENHKKSCSSLRTEKWRETNGQRHFLSGFSLHLLTPESFFFKLPEYNPDVRIEIRLSQQRVILKSQVLHCKRFNEI